MYVIQFSFFSYFYYYYYYYYLKFIIVVINSEVAVKIRWVPTRYVSENTGCRNPSFSPASILFLCSSHSSFYTHDSVLSTVLLHPLHLILPTPFDTIRHRTN